MTEQAHDDPARLAASQRCRVVLPAGAGKTELIARGVLCNSSAEGQQLVLTHTHAGVHAIKDRLRKLRVSATAYRVQTLDGFALRFVRHFPGLAGTTISEPENGRAWEEVRQGAARIFRSKHLRRVLRQSYAGIYVDEYQDCGLRQHELVLLLAEELPTRILGDPLQGIFEFDGVVDWARQVAPEFPELSVTEMPWRWQKTNPELGKRLQEIRRCLIEGRTFSLEASGVIAWLSQRPENQVKACHEAAEPGKNVVALHRWANQCHSLARRLNGSFSSMEELASKELMRTAVALDEAASTEVPALMLDFAKRCMTRLPPGIGQAVKSFRAGKRPRTSPGRKNQEVYFNLNHLADEPSPEAMLKAMDAVEGIPETFIHRRECWHEMKRALRIYQAERSSGVESLKDAVLRVRDRTRRLGRMAERRAISRTLLVKGLEYDHAILLDADQMKDARELYVAFTRGRSALTVISENRRFWRPAVPIE
jgi:hypothetical protein